MKKIFVSFLLVCLNWISAENSKNSNDLLEYLNFEKANQQFVCPTPYGKYRHRECHKYWVCSKWLAYEFNCPPGLYYNENKEECDYPQNVECSPNPTPIEEETTSEIDSATSVSDFICPEEFGAFPHEDCTKFWECIRFYGYEKSCPEGKAWNDLTKDCDEKSYDTCFNSTEPKTEEPTTEEPFVCPKKNGHFAHQNCWMFWLCSNWIPYEFLCPKGTAWNDKIKVCDWPINAGCDLP